MGSTGGNSLLFQPPNCCLLEPLPSSNRRCQRNAKGVNKGLLYEAATGSKLILGAAITAMLNEKQGLAGLSQWGCLGKLSLPHQCVMGDTLFFCGL